MKRNTKSELIAKKLKDVGQWKKFSERKLELETSGLSTSQAYKQAVSEFAKFLTFDNSGPPDGDGNYKLPDFVNLKKSDFAGKPECSEQSAISWACKFYTCKDIKKADAPSRFAWNIMQELRADSDFRKDILKKRVPNISKAEQDGAFIDDGRKQFKLIDKLLVESEQGGGSQSVQDNDGVLPKTLSGPKQT